MAKKAKWGSLDHNEKLSALRLNAVEQLLKDYAHDDLTEEQFRQILVRERSLWQAHLYPEKSQQKGQAPNKEVVLGAWRDLDRAEAILELIDNSIDAWSRRMERYPDKTASELIIYIDIDADTGQLAYEDNAGGVSVDNLENLVVPGFSETDALAHSIGSYKTGGKKAIFRLATAVNITTRYWNPVGTTDDAVSVHLDEEWLRDVRKYEFPYFTLKDKSAIHKGQTRYVMQLREEPKDNPWYRLPDQRSVIEREIQDTYSLLIARRHIKIFFTKRGKPVLPRLENLYDFSGAATKKVDIRPQCVRFNAQLEHDGKAHEVAIEIVVGCRVTVGAGDGKAPGFDLYGNNRLFVAHDERLFSEFLPKGNAANLIRGFVNILGPNVFIPWDTHKRHLNYDREIIDVLQTHPAIKQLIENWGDAAQQISRLGKGKYSTLISKPLPKLIDGRTGDLAVPHKDEVSIDASRKRGERLPPKVFKPAVTAKKEKQDIGITLSISLNTDDARQLAARWQVEGSIEAGKTKKMLGERIKDYLRKLIGKGGKK